MILIDVLLDQYEFQLPFTQTEEKVIAFEQSVLDRSNEIDLGDLAAGNKHSQRYAQLELYDYVLTVAWEHENTKSPDEVNLLRKLRDRLNITESDHRLMEAKLEFTEATVLKVKRDGRRLPESGRTRGSDA